MRTKAQWTAISLATFFFGCASPTSMTETPATQTPATAAGIGASAASTAAAGAAAPVSVACGTTTCSGIAIPAGVGGALPGGLALPTPCCADPAMGLCGTLSGATCMAKPAVASKCPAIPPVFGMAVNACCLPDMTCGVDASMLGMGCVTSAGLARFGGMVPPPAMCDGTLLPMTTPPATAAGGAALPAAGAVGLPTAGGLGAAGLGAAAGSSAAAGIGAAGVRAAAGTGAAGVVSSAAGTTGAAGVRAGAGTGAAGR